VEQTSQAYITKIQIQPLPLPLKLIGFSFIFLITPLFIYFSFLAQFVFFLGNPNPFWEGNSLVNLFYLIGLVPLIVGVGLLKRIKLAWYGGMGLS